ncbi:MAG TPA: hypothetical protein VGL53_23915 [Bryobacteraceae bacterium]|jgi:hypothetical protein
MQRIRERAKQILKEVPAPPAQITTKSDPQLFARLTGGGNQKALDDAWAKGKNLTYCNAFTGWYGSQLGPGPYMGVFELEKFVKDHGKARSWVASTMFNRPKYGDICRHTAFHVGVSLDFEGSHWHHVDAGQGGQTAKCDILKRTYSSTPYDHANLQGWVDIARYFGQDPFPDWLAGWWNVSWRGEDLYYFFTDDWEVQWTDVAPQSRQMSPVAMIGKGGVEPDGPTGIVIGWEGEVGRRVTSASGNVESLTRMPDGTLSGMFNRLEPVTARR